MARILSAAQYKSKMQQLQNKRKQAIDKYNREVRQHNQKVKSDVNRRNAEINRHNQKVKNDVNKHNAKVRTHNARVRSNRQKIASELRRLQSNTTTVRYQSIRTSAVKLNSHYEHLDAKENEFEDIQNGSSFLDLSERENANSLAFSNILESNETPNDTDPSLLLRSEINDMLVSISPELNDRWKGALFSLNPDNPDAARHFCTSAREVFIKILDVNAPDEKILNLFPNCETTDRGQPTRREKIKFLLNKKGILSNAAVDFVDEDVKNVLSLFRVFNDGTHGSSGRFSIDKLMAIKIRVENGISYLYEISNPVLH